MKDELGRLGRENRELKERMARLEGVVAGLIAEEPRRVGSKRGREE
jgi:hypothetical protein